MANDMTDAIGKTARRTAKTVSKAARRNGALGVKGVAAGAGLAALPLAAKGVGALAKRGAEPAKKAAKGGKQALSKNGGGGGSGKNEAPGVGKGRRMPIQQAVDVAVPLKTAYNAWTQFEEWPQFMHRLENVSQEDDTHVRFKTKIWGISKEFLAEIEEQRPDQRIKWNVTEGVTHNGVVTFHELAERLTRIEVNVDLEPGSLIEKAARGMRHTKRAVRADLARFKAYVEMEEDADGSWRGTVDGGRVKRRSGAGGRSSRSRSGGGSSRSRGGSSASRSRSSSSRSRASSSGARSSSKSKGSATRARSKSSSSNGAKASGSGRGRSSSSGSRSSGNGRSGSRSSSRKKTGSRS